MAIERDILALFPQLSRQIRGRKLVYLDSAATTLKPIPVIEAMTKHLREQTSNVHRGAHFLADEATTMYENTREKVAKFVGAQSKNEIIFTRGTTEGINLLARSLGSMALFDGDEIVVSQMEHHSNIVPWQMIAQEKRAKVRFVPVLDDGTLDFSAFEKMLSKRTKIVSLVHLSNSLGTVNPLAKFFNEAKKFGAYCVADAAQSISAGPVDMKTLNCDFMVFSGHKAFAPTGVGVLYGKLHLLEKMPPYQGGGSMISEVRENGTDYLPPPHRFEAGTPAIAEIIGLGVAIDFMNDIGFDYIERHERKLAAVAKDALSKVPGLKRIGQAPDQKHVISFLIEGSHPSDVGAILDEQGIAIRAGHHCCQPLMKRFGIPGTARASFSIYSTEADVEQLAAGLRKAGELLR